MRWKSDWDLTERWYERYSGSSVPDVVKALADNKTDEAFNKAVAEAAKQQVTSQD
mgnify:CR=1 FL=1